MKRGWLLVFACCLSGLAWAQQDETLTLDELLESGQEWAQEHLDDQALQTLGEIDEAKARAFLRDFQARFQGEYVVDLAALGGRAEALVPVLERFEATRPYAAWLRPRLDYFKAAEEFRLIIPPPKPEPGQPPPPTPNPTAEQEQRVWRAQLAQRPVPRTAAAYVKELKPVFVAQQLPAELVWLAEVESSFDPAAVSPAGAAGLFQLMPATAKGLGLALSPRDERFDPEKSAGASARHLRYLYGRFKDWPLALAAYNCGDGRLQAALTKYQARTFAQVAPHLPAETQMYVPKMDAVLLRREGTVLAKLPAPGS